MYQKIFRCGTNVVKSTAHVNKIYQITKIRHKLFLQQDDDSHPHLTNLRNKDIDKIFNFLQDCIGCTFDEAAITVRDCCFTVIRRRPRDIIIYRRNDTNINTTLPVSFFHCLVNHWREILQDIEMDILAISTMNQTVRPLKLTDYCRGVIVQHTLKGPVTMHTLAESLEGVIPETLVDLFR